MRWPSQTISWLEVCRDAVGDIRGVLAELPTRVYYTTLGGFDTHANQAATQNTPL